MMKKKFPDMSGDGKVTKKDVLMAKGVIGKDNKDKNMKKVIMMKSTGKAAPSKMKKEAMMADAKKVMMKPAKKK